MICPENRNKIEGNNKIYLTKQVYLHRSTSNISVVRIKHENITDTFHCFSYNNFMEIRPFLCALPSDIQGKMLNQNFTRVHPKHTALLNGHVAPKHKPCTASPHRPLLERLTSEGEKYTLRMGGNSVISTISPQFPIYILSLSFS